MKIGFATWFFPKLSETFILNQVEFLLRRGHDITVLACFDPARRLAREDYEPERIRHSFAGELLRHKRVQYVEPRKPRLFWEAVKARKISVVHFQFPDLANHFLEHLPQNFRQAVFTTVHNLNDIRTTKDTATLGRNLWHCLRKSTVILPTSLFVQHQLHLVETRLGIARPARYHLHHMGVDTDFFKTVALQSRRPFTISFVGRFVEKKGLADAIAAFALFSRHTRRKSQFLIAGGGTDFPLLKQKIARLTCRKEITLIPKVTQHEVKELLSRSDVFLHPSKTAADGDQEGIPVALMEAGAMQLPVVSTFHTGIPELVLHNTSGLLAAEGDVPALARHLDRLARSDSFRKFFGKNGRAIVLRDFNIQKQTEKLEQYYEASP